MQVHSQGAKIYDRKGDVFLAAEKSLPGMTTVTPLNPNFGRNGAVQDPNEAEFVEVTVNTGDLKGEKVFIQSDAIGWYEM